MGGLRFQYQSAMSESKKKKVRALHAYCGLKWRAQSKVADRNKNIEGVFSHTIGLAEVQTPEHKSKTQGKYSGGRFDKDHRPQLVDDEL